MSSLPDRSCCSLEFLNDLFANRKMLQFRLDHYLWAFLRPSEEHITVKLKEFLSTDSSASFLQDLVGEDWCRIDVKVPDRWMRDSYFRPVITTMDHFGKVAIESRRYFGIGEETTPDADDHFTRDPLFQWCEASGTYIFYSLRKTLGPLLTERQAKRFQFDFYINQRGKEAVKGIYKRLESGEMVYKLFVDFSDQSVQIFPLMGKGCIWLSKADAVATIEQWFGLTDDEQEMWVHRLHPLLIWSQEENWEYRSILRSDVVPFQMDMFAGVNVDEPRHVLLKEDKDNNHQFYVYLFQSGRQLPGTTKAGGIAATKRAIADFFKS